VLTIRVNLHGALRKFRLSLPLLCEILNAIKEANEKMITYSLRSVPIRMSCSACALLVLMAPSRSEAHVKWFSGDADCSMQPLTPLQVLGTPGFLSLAGFCFLVMMCVSHLDALLSNSRVSSLADRVDAIVSGQLVAYFRYSLAAFFCTAIIYFGNEPVFLTPELHARSMWVAPLQAGIAMALMQRGSAWLGSLGIAVLYVLAMQTYGWFHLLDYPVFLGAAVFIAIDSIWQGRRHDLALAVLRVSAGVTLMWAGVEKWLYPWWSYSMLDNELKDLRGALTSNYFMVAAGFVEFCAAYALVFGRTSVQLAAAVLLIPFILAVPVFGRIDAIGHAPIIAVLAVLAVTRNRVTARVPGAVPGGAGAAHTAVAHAVSCSLAGAAMLGLYWGLQALAYPPLIATDAGMGAVAVLLCLPLLLWTLPHAGGAAASPAQASPWLRMRAWAGGAVPAMAPAWQWVRHWAGAPGAASMRRWPLVARWVATSLPPQTLGERQGDH
jgi:hypothetical protein